MLNHVSLFSGIGGLDLAAEAAGFETVLQVEREPYALEVLNRHWPTVPKITDVRAVTRESVKESVTVVSGGFPCQPFSSAGKRRGADDDRYLWPELLRIVEELRPTWVVGENVSGLLSIDGGMEIERMLASLEARDYEVVGVLHYPAAGVGAHHKRDRVFIVANANSSQREGGGVPIGIHTEHADTSDARRGRAQPHLGRMANGLPDWVDGEPLDIPRTATGVANRAARLKALGNAVVPAQAYPIFASIANVEASNG